MQFAARMSKQIINIQKTFLNNVFDTQALWQAQADHATQTMLDQAHAVIAVLPKRRGFTDFENPAWIDDSELVELEV